MQIALYISASPAMLLYQLYYGGLALLREDHCGEAISNSIEVIPLRLISPHYGRNKVEQRLSTSAGQKFVSHR